MNIVEKPRSTYEKVIQENKNEWKEKLGLQEVIAKSV